jgi:tetratricopeptide (TPR) repeat protein
MSLALLLLLFGAGGRTPVEKALDLQDRSALEKIASEATEVADHQPTDHKAQHQSAVANSALAQLAIETSDKALGKAAAEAGIRAGQRATKLQPNNAEYHRLLGTLCGQIIPANVMAGMKYGRCASQEVAKAIELDAKSSMAWTSRGVGNYYMPAAFGGGVNLAIDDFKKALELDPNNSEAHLWLGIALRKSGKNADARKAIAKSLELNPARKWAKQQLEKTPAQ